MKTKTVLKGRVPAKASAQFGGFTPVEVETARSRAFEEAQRQARFRRWDELEAAARTKGLAKPAHRPVKDAVWQEITLPTTPRVEPKIPAGAFLTPKPQFEEEAPTAPRNERVIVLPNVAFTTRKPQQRSELVIRLEAAKKLAHSSAAVATQQTVLDLSDAEPVAKPRARKPTRRKPKPKARATSRPAAKKAR